MKIYKKTGLTTINLSPKKIWQFPGGETGVKLGDAPIGTHSKGEYTTIIQRIRNGDDIMAIALAKDAIQRMDEYPAPIRLFIPYVPYARQDRVCVPGESLSIKVFADIINAMGFERVYICDPHSAVTEAVIKNVWVFTQFDIISRFEAFKKRILTSDVVFISPDAGAKKKTEHLAIYFLGREQQTTTEIAYADKVRNLATGEIISIKIDRDDFKGKDVVICDDICDGGRTFIELAKILKAKNCGKVILYVTHGIFSKGCAELYKNGIDEIYTTNSFKVDFTAGVVAGEPTEVFDVETGLIRL